MVGVNNYKMLTKMSFDRKVIKSLFEIYNILKEDKNFNINKYIKMMSSMLKGEKLIEFEDKYIISAFYHPFLLRHFIQI